MPLNDPAFWSEHLRQNLHLYDEALLRQVAGNLIKPRSHWPVEDLIRRMVETSENTPVIDRRLKELPAACRHLLAFMDHSRKSCWYVGHLVELLTALGHDDALAAVTTLLDNGLLYPYLQATANPPGPEASTENQGNRQRCKTFSAWLGNTTPAQLIVCSHPVVTRRAATEALPLPDLSQVAESAVEGASAPEETISPAATIHEGDGLEMLLRMAILWQQVRVAPLRRTLQGDFFKRDFDRLRADPLLAGTPAESVMELPDLGLLTAALAQQEKILVADDGQLLASNFPARWSEGLPVALASLWQGLLGVEEWNIEQGWTGPRPANPYPSAYLLCLLLLAQLPRERWCPAARIANWVMEHHPFWQLKFISATGKNRSKPLPLSGFLLGLAYHLKLVQAVKNADGDWLVRLSEIGRWLMGQRELPKVPSFQQTLLVQPNLEILVYRQGLTPELLARISRFGMWKTLGAACNMKLEPESVYSALEAGETFDSIIQTLQRHGFKPPPPSVIDLLRTWSQKRERITVYPAGIILEFLNAEDMQESINRGVSAVPIAAQLAVLPSEAGLDYRHFRLISNRDYTLPPERCVSMEADGVTLRVDLNRSDLLLESELRRFAEEVETSGSVRSFRMTPATLQRGQELGVSLESLEAWFQARCDQPLSPAAWLLFQGKNCPAPQKRRLTIIEVADEVIADGLLQWPETKPLLRERLGPTALVIEEEQLPLLKKKLAALGITIEAG